MRVARHSLLAVLLFTLAIVLPLRAWAADYTDIWWGGQAESGWGVNFVQDEDVVFATFYIYDTAKKPIWVSSPMFVNAAGSYSGNLYLSAGSFFGDPWDPKDVPNPLPAVGTAAFIPTSATTGTLTYTVNNVPGIPNTLVKKNIQRSNFRTIVLGGNYVGTGVVTDTGCSDTSKNGTSILDVDPQITQDTSGQVGITLTFGTETCTLSGQAIQEGQLFRIPGANYFCQIGNTTTLNATATVYEVKATAVGIEGRWLANNLPNLSGCQENGTFSAVLN